MSNLVSLFGIVPEDWNVDKIGDIFTLSQGLQISSTKRIQEKKDNYIPLLKITDLPHRRFSEFVTKIEPQYIASVNDIIYTRTGNVGLVYTDVEGCVHNNCFKVNFDRDLFDKYYVYYYLKSKQVFIYSNQVATGSVQKDLTHPSFKSCIFAYPTLNEQNKIGIIIKNFDDKIELNNQMNQTLEDMATTLFKEWFENFNFPNEQGKPYKDNDGEMKSSELGEIPIDWEVKYLKEISETISKGTTPKKNEVDGLDSNIYFLKVKDINNDGTIEFSSLEKIPIEVHQKQLKRSILKTDDILVSIAGTIGRTSIVPSSLDDSNCNQAIAFIRLKNKNVYKKFIYQWIRTLEVQNRIQSGIVQGVQANVSLTTLGDLRIILPNDLIMNKFNSLINPIFEQIQQNQQQNQTLKQQRDTLLPKLISGEIRV